jgi:hypothetical protein
MKVGLSGSQCALHQSILAFTDFRAGGLNKESEEKLGEK